MKKIVIILSTVLISCGGSSAPPFTYEDNSRFIVEAILQTENGDALNNQKLELNSTSNYNAIIVKTIFSDSNGKIFLSVPRGNYAYAINFFGEKIISMQHNSELIYLNSSNQNTGILYNLNSTYYDLGIVKLINN